MGIGAVLWAVISQYHTLLGRDAGVALLSAMTALKVLEARTLRDAVVLVFLGYLLAVASLLYSQSVAMVGYLMLSLVVLLAAQTVVQPGHGALVPRELLGLAARMLIQSIPLMLILFVLFPRIPGPLWRLPIDAHAGFTGLSDTMTPGAISHLSRSDAVAFRVRFLDGEPDPRQLYWRGPVLDRFDGRTWSAVREPVHGSVPAYGATAESVDYAVILEPHGKRWLFALDLPAVLPDRVGITESFQLQRAKPLTHLLRYQMRSHLDYRTGPLSPRQREANLQLPLGGGEHARDLAQEWQRQLVPGDRVEAALRLFRQQPFSYTLLPPLLGDNPVDEFLFGTLRGFCEHFAGSFVFLMRAAGVPARVVTGYQGGERSELGEYWIVRQSDAHAWAEVWLEDRGWIRIDPTAAIAPERVEKGLYAAIEEIDRLPLLIRRDMTWIHRLALGWDYLDNAWNEWVLSYGPDRQRRLFDRLGLGDLGWWGPIAGMLLGLGWVGAIFLALRVLRERRAADPVARAYQRFCAKLARNGLSRRPHEGPLAFAERVALERPELAARVRLIGRLYAGLRYGRLEGEDRVRHLCGLVSGLRLVKAGKNGQVQKQGPGPRSAPRSKRLPSSVRSS